MYGELWACTPVADAGLPAWFSLYPRRQGGVLPAFQLQMAAPRAPGSYLAHRLIALGEGQGQGQGAQTAGQRTETGAGGGSSSSSSGAGRVVAEWPPRDVGPPQYAFQQVGSVG